MANLMMKKDWSDLTGDYSGVEGQRCNFYSAC